ncbi:MAG: hypothetical protein VX278_15025 [Myxococcota bacterium]|nr:hypothetical protein [Myxococcota bacterium]
MIAYSYFSLLACTAHFPELHQPSGSAPYLLFITHGSGDSIEDWPLALAASIEEYIAEPEMWDIWVYDWHRDAANKLTASGSGTKHGEYISEHLKHTSYTHYHFVAHSVGAFVIHTLEQKLNTQATIQSTYLDPFCGSGIFDWEYGHRRFGEYAHFSEAYVNMDDGVPSTDSPLQQSFVFDVTSRAPEEEDRSRRHWSPISLYEQSILQEEEEWGFNNTVEAGNPPHQHQPSEYPKGGILIVD